jgi:MFS family permease
VTVYVTSYLRIHDSSITYNDTVLIYALIILGQALVMTVGGTIELRTGPRPAAALGSLFLVGSTLAASRITSLWGMALCFGLCFGFGGGLTYTVPLVCGYRWDAEKKGWISGVVLSGFGASALVFNLVQSKLVNPDNLKPEIEYKNHRYFGPGPVTDAVPGLFVKLAGIYAALALVGVLLLRDPAYKKIDDGSSARAGLLQAGANGDGGGAGGGGGASPLRRRLYESYDAANGEEADAGGGSGGSFSGGDEEPTPKGYYSGGDGGGASAEKGGADTDMTPSQLLRTPQAWHLSLCFLLGSLSGLVTLSTYKSYGISTFVDDHFMSFVVGSFASACNAMGRILWGALSDRIGAYRTLRTASLIQALALFTWNLTIQPLDSKWAFGVWVGLVCLCHGGGFAVYPALVADRYGKTNAASNFGVIFLGYGIVSLIGLAVLPRLSAALSPLNHFLGTIALLAAINITCLERCYGDGGSSSQKAPREGPALANGNGRGNGFVLLAQGHGGGSSPAASLN